jgi:hypothetical protein
MLFAEERELKSSCEPEGVSGDIVESVFFEFFDPENPDPDKFRTWKLGSPKKDFLEERGEVPDFSSLFPSEGNGNRVLCFFEFCCILVRASINFLSKWDRA